VATPPLRASQMKPKSSDHRKPVLSSSQNVPWEGLCLSPAGSLPPEPGYRVIIFRMRSRIAGFSLCIRSCMCLAGSRHILTWFARRSTVVVLVCALHSFHEYDSWFWPLSRGTIRTGCRKKWETRRKKERLRNASSKEKLDLTQKGGDIKLG
jgi:hypothetical protein